MLAFFYGPLHLPPDVKRQTHPGRMKQKARAPNSDGLNPLQGIAKQVGSLAAPKFFVSLHFDQISTELSPKLRLA
jgi:hypothetical protein